MTDWTDAQKQAIEGGEDYKTIVQNIVKLTNQLVTRWTLVVDSYDTKQPVPISGRALHQIYEKAVGQVNAAFLVREQQRGKTWSSVDEFINSSGNDIERTTRRNHLRLLAWRSAKGNFLEALCLASLLSRMQPIGKPDPVDIFAKLGPIHLKNEDGECFLWTRPNTPDAQSGLRAIPDIVITSTDHGVDRSNILSIVECKCRQELGAADIRAEFGKAYDLGSPSYTLLSYYEPRPHIAQAASELGLDLEVFQLGTIERSLYVTGTKDLAADLTQTLDTSRKRKSFLNKINERRDEVRAKLPDAANT